MQAVADGLDSIRSALQFILKHNYTSWSLENVATPAVRTLVDEYVAAWPDRVAYAVLDAADFGTPSSRLRLFAGPPALIKHLREMPVRRMSVAQVFENAGVKLPAWYIKNGTRTRNGKPCVRSVQGPAHTALASHPFTWCTANGVTIRCLSVSETSLLLGFPSDWMLPSGIRAIGNCVAPSVAEAIMRAACEARRQGVGHSARQ